jgi:hypothetical protein
VRPPARAEAPEVDVSHEPGRRFPISGEHPADLSRQEAGELGLRMLRVGRGEIEERLGCGLELLAPERDTRI